MNAERLLKHYENIADAPDAMARLRRFILDLAVRGKLVPQDATDELASELLKRIAKEKAQLVKAGEIRRREDLPELADDEYPFPLPHSWSWCRLGSLGRTQTGTTPPKAKPEHYGDYIPFIKPGDLYPSHVEYANDGLSKQGVAEVGRIATPGSILMVCIGTIGKCQLIDRNCSFNQQINSLSPFSGIASRYLLAACQSEMFQKAAWTASARTTIAILNKGNWELLLFPLPPLAEQHRIVAKVDELMGLCDRLEGARAGCETVRDRLAAASLARLNAPDPETFQDDARFVLDALPAFTTRPDQIKALRQTILNLAVRGKLVSQDQNDEPASELLKRITQEKLRLISEKKLKRQKELLPIEMENVPFNVPVGWEWSKADDVFLNITDGFHNTPSPVTEGFPYVTAKHIRPNRIDFENCLYVDAKNHRELTAKTRVKRGDILIVNIGAGCGMPAMVDVDFEFSFKNVAIVNLPSDMDGNFILQFLLYYRDLVFDDLIKGGAQPFLGLGMLREMLIPLPPLPEQHRVVAKVDELMALCDRLEASLTATATNRRRLLDALLAEALAPTKAHELEAIQ